jgi:signal peptidase II
MGSVPAAEVAGTVPITWSIRRLCAMLGLITLPILGLDQSTKSYVAAHLRLYSSHQIIPNWLDVTYTLNPGAAFSFFSTMPAMARGIFFMALSCIATVVRGRVVDFIFFHHDWFSYPVFNVADSAITIGVAIILLTGIVASRERVAH